MADDLRLVLLRSIPESQWPELTAKLAEFEINEEQRNFGGDPASLVGLSTIPERNVFVIVTGNVLAGVGSLMTGDVSPELWPPQSRVIQLRGFVIDGRLQGQGIGSEASRHLVELARSVDSEAEHLVLTVNQRNPGAKRTYEKAGFQTLPDPYLGGPLGPQDIMFVSLQ